MRILLVEDDEVLADVLVRSLTEQYYVVDVVEDGQMGWEFLSKFFCCARLILFLAKQ